MKKFFELFLVVFVIFFGIYTILYYFYFDEKCNIYSWNNNIDIQVWYSLMASCKDSLICELKDIETNERNVPSSWLCAKKKSPVFTIDLYKSISDNFINSVVN